MNHLTERDVRMELMIKIIEARGDSYRVSINDDGTFTVVDFTLPRATRPRLRQNIPQVDVDQWMMEKVSILRIAPEGNLIKGIGFKVHDRLYYIEHGDHDEHTA